ncbi:MAG: hypothetical protein ACLRSW_02225 [Christensenellaceae bacterium]
MKVIVVGVGKAAEISFSAWWRKATISWSSIKMRRRYKPSSIDTIDGALRKRVYRGKFERGGADTADLAISVTRRTSKTFFAV